MEKHKITVLPGDGVGPAIVDSAVSVLEALDCGLEFEKTPAGESALEEHGNLLPDATLESIARNRIALKGPLTTPIASGYRSLNVALRQKFELYANLRPVVSMPGTRSRYEDIDIVTIRENTQGMYSGEGQEVTECGNIARATSVITREGSERIIRFAFDYARKHGRRKVTVIHKANILKSTSALFLKIAREIAAENPGIEMNEMIVDNCCMQLVMDPHQFDVIVTTNLMGDIISDLCAGLVGGLGMAPGANIGADTAIFEAVHGSAPDIAGKNVANPTSLLLAAALMLDHLGMDRAADKLKRALADAIRTGDRTTPDLGGSGTTTGFTQAIIERL